MKKAVIPGAFFKPVAGFVQQMRNVERRHGVGANDGQRIARNECRQRLAGPQGRQRTFQALEIENGMGHVRKGRLASDLSFEARSGVLQGAAPFRPESGAPVRGRDLVGASDLAPPRQP